MARRLAGCAFQGGRRTSGRHVKASQRGGWREICNRTGMSLMPRHRGPARDRWPSKPPTPTWRNAADRDEGGTSERITHHRMAPHRRQGAAESKSLRARCPGADSE